MTTALDPPGVPETVLEEVARVYKGRVVWGRDLMTLSVPWASRAGDSG